MPSGLGKAQQPSSLEEFTRRAETYDNGEVRDPPADLSIVFGDGRALAKSALSR